MFHVKTEIKEENECLQYIEENDPLKVTETSDEFGINYKQEPEEYLEDKETYLPAADIKIKEEQNEDLNGDTKYKGAPTIVVNNIPDFNSTLESFHNSEFQTAQLNHLVSPPYQDLRTFLNSSFEGQLILFYYEKHNTLSDVMLNHLTRLVINREIHQILQSENVSVKKPLKKLEVPSKNLKRLAEEISAFFNERTGTFYTPVQGDKENRVASSGKLISRVNYMRKILVDCGVLAKGNKDAPPVPQIPLDSKSQLNILKENTVEWSVIEKTWKDTYTIRQQLLKQKADKNIWEYSEFRCLASSKGSSLLIADYNTKYPDNNIKIEDVWESLRETLLKFIRLRKLSDTVQVIIDVLNSSKENQDALILMLLPYAIKASALPNTRKTNKPEIKRQKVDTPKITNAENNYYQENEFILHVNIAADLEKKIEEQHDYLRSINERVYPFMVFLGPLSSLEEFYVIIDKIQYKTQSAIDALDLTFRIFLACNCNYPKSMNQSWLFVQKLLYRLNIRGDKCSSFLNKSLTFFQKELNIKIE